ncbi:MAG: extracellular solute-binding protein [Phycisphaerae bacterium]
MDQIGRILRGILALVAAAATLAAFAWVFVLRPLSAAEKHDSQRTEITFIHWGDDTEDKIVSGIVEAFHRAHPEIHVLRVNPGNAPDVTRKIQTMIAAGDPPDVFYLGYENVASWAAKGLLEPLEPYMKRDLESRHPQALALIDFYPAVTACFRYDEREQITGQGSLFGIPKDFTTVGFYYNRDLFRRAGLPEPSPDGWTWDEFIHAAREIGKLPNCFGADFVTWEAMLRVYAWNLGGTITHDGFKTFDFNDPKFVGALEQLLGWFNEGRTLASAKTQIETSSDPFLTGRIGLAGPFGRWKVPVYREITDFDWDFAPMPHAPGQVPVNGIFTTAWAISSGSKKKDAAWTFVRFVSGEVGQTLISRTGLAIPSMIRVAESDAFKDPQKPENDDVYLRAVADARPIAWPPDPKYADEFRVRMEEAFKSGTKTVRAALAAVQAKWEEFRRATVLRADYPRMPWGRITAWVLGPLAVVVLALATMWWMQRPGRTALREELAGMGMVSPWVIGFAGFTAFPIVLSLLLSFTQWSGLATLDRASAVGWDNYRQLLLDARFLKALKVTTVYALLAVPLGQLAALLAAILMNQEVRGIYFFRAAWYLPSVLAGVAISILWSKVFHHEFGLLNELLAPLAEGVNWLLARLNMSARVAPPHWFERDADTWGVPAFVIMNFWSIGGAMMIYLAGLKGIPAELYEAASIDGARGLQRFRCVTLPMLSPVIFFNVIMAVIASFQIFTQAYVMTGGGPGDATRFYVVYLYNQAFDLHEMGYASAMAWLLLLIVLALTLLIMWGSRRFVYYEALKT